MNHIVLHLATVEFFTTEICLLSVLRQKPVSYCKRKKKYMPEQSVLSYDSSHKQLIASQSGAKGNAWLLPLESFSSLDSLRSRLAGACVHFLNGSINKRNIRYD